MKYEQRIDMHRINYIEPLFLDSELEASEPSHQRWDLPLTSSERNVTL